jgi:hypothetical protein
MGGLEELVIRRRRVLAFRGDIEKTPIKFVLIVFHQELKKLPIMYPTSRVIACGKRSAGVGLVLDVLASANKSPVRFSVYR